MGLRAGLQIAFVLSFGPVLGRPNLHNRHTGHSPSAGVFLHASVLLNRMRVIGCCRKPSFNCLSSGSSLRVCEVRGMALVVEPAAEEDDGVASPHGSLADP